MPHGVSTGFKKATRNALAARDVPAGDSWAFRDHRTMEKVRADEQASRRAAHPASVARRMVDMLRS